MSYALIKKIKNKKPAANDNCLGDKLISQENSQEGKKRGKDWVYLGKSHDTCSVTPHITACAALISPSCSIMAALCRTGWNISEHELLSPETYRKDSNLECRQVKDMIHQRSS